MSDQHEYSTVTPPKSEALVLFIKEIFVDIFGIMIPGFCFLVMLVFALVIPIMDFMRLFTNLHYAKLIWEFLSENTGTAFFSSFVISYVFGHLFFRCDPKAPDVNSIMRLYRSKKFDFGSGCVRLLDKGCDEYPYGYLKEYLNERGFDDLAVKVTWSGSDFEKVDSPEKKHRSKHFINLIKLSIKFRNPSLFFEIVRNEAHVRLMSSVWYVCYVIAILSVIGLIVGAAANYVSTQQVLAKHLVYGEAVVFPAAMLVVALSIKITIERFFHYQRVREIVFVLQTWNLIDPPARDITG